MCGGEGIKYLKTFRDIGAVLCGGEGIKYHETFRDICRSGAKGGGLLGVDHEMFRDLLAVISMNISEPQSRTVPMYIAF